MKSKTIRIKLTAFALAACILSVIGAPPVSRAYTPSVSTLRIGLYYGSGALQSANLQNADGYGRGYEFGYFDAQRNFISIGAAIDVAAISMIKDRNMYYYSDSSTKEYRAGKEGSVVVGCYHIQLDASFDTFYDAKAVSEQYQSSFVKYSSGRFYVCTGNYTSEEAAVEAIYTRGIQSCSVNSGTPTTVTVVETGTNRILFEFDYGSQYYFGVMPVSTGAKCETWFKGFKYYGGFQYARLDGGDITVSNFVNIEDYVKGVVQHEMNNKWPLEALKAQACCARTYAVANLNRHRSDGFDLCTGEHCQVYKGRNGANDTSDRAVDETANIYITYNGSLCQTYFSSSDGGATENVENVWNEAIPYLRGVIDPYEATVASIIPNYNWKLTYTPEQLTQRLRERYSCGTIVSMSAQYSALGNVVKVTLKDSNGTTINIINRDKINVALGVPSIRFTLGGRTQPGSSGSIYVNGSSNTLPADTSSYYVLGGDGVASQVSGGSAYAITGTGEMEMVSGDTVENAGGSSDGKVNGVFTIEGTGRGHNVGMSQYGAYSMALHHNKTYRDIINFYFTGVTIG